MATVAMWSGREVRALRHARRMSVREFAAHLGVSDRMVSKWEAGGSTVRPRPHNQAALDTSLQLADRQAQQRFAAHVPTDTITTDGRHAGPAMAHVVRHPIDGKPMTFVEPGPCRSRPTTDPVWLPGFFIDTTAVTNAEYGRFVEATDHPHAPYWTGRLGYDDDPVVGIDWHDVIAYARWAAKASPTLAEWDRAAAGTEGVNPSGLAEWCRSTAGPIWRGRRPQSRAQTGFRCVVTATDMLALLAI